MPVAGLIGVLIAAPTLSTRVTWSAPWTMLALAVLSPVLPFALEFLALRRLTTSALGTVMSLETRPRPAERLPRALSEARAWPPRPASPAWSSPASAPPGTATAAPKRQPPPPRPTHSRARRKCP